MGIIGEILQNILSTFCGGEDNAKQRHDLVETFWDRRGRLLSMVPFILILAIANTDIIAAVWSAFGVQIFLVLVEFYRSRYNPMVAFPNIINMSFLLGYVLCIIFVYVLVPPMQNIYISAVVVTCVFGGMVLSLICQYPFTMQMSAPRVDEETRRSPQFYKFNQIISLFWVVIVALTMVCAWCATLFASNSPGQIVLGIVMPILFPVMGHIATPYLIDYLKSHGKNTKKDEETSNLLEKA